MGRSRLLVVLTSFALACTSAGTDGAKKKPGPTGSDTDDSPDVFPESDPPQVVLNEVMPGNESTLNGTDGDSTPDYVELVNVGTEDVSLSRLELASADGRWTGPADGVIAPGERALVYFDIAADDVGLWTGFGLDKENDTVELFGDGFLLGSVDLDDLASDVALTRIPDITGDFVPTAWPSPGLANGDEPSASLDTSDATLFVTDRVHEIRFTMTPQAFNNINDSSRPVVHVEIAIDGVHYPDVGLGLKGSASYDTMDGKPAFKVDMNRFVKGTRFRGQRGLGLHNGMVYDATRTHDYMSYGLAREAGLLAPRVGWAEVWVNDEPYGVYMIIERFEEEFIEYRRPGHGETGMVFEGNTTMTGGGWANDFGDGGAPSFDMEEGVVPPPAEAIASITAVDTIVGGNPTDEAVAELWTHLHKDRFLTYMAWEAVIEHWDGYKSPNNWRFYIDPETFQLEWVPSGAEWTWDDDADVYGSNGNVVEFCLDNPGCRYDFSVKVLEIADLADSMDLVTTFEELSALLDPAIQSDPRYESVWGLPGVAEARGVTVQHLVNNPEHARNQVYQEFPDLAP